MRRSLILFALVACVVCTLDALANESRRTIDVSRALDAGPLECTSDMTIVPIPADPSPLVEREQWVFDLRWDRGEVWLLGVQGIQLAVPQPSPRAMGRFAVELYEGRALIERVRFDFPLLGASESDAGMSFAKRLGTRIGVVFPATKRGTRLELWDRASNRRWILPWPPTLATRAADAGALPRPHDAGQAS
ncbi:MAG: hypothetical protein M3O46_08845 [Myxococcota bacterium]|nr:hypothetical protein [Myxococcota bacterium]